LTFLNLAIYGTVGLSLFLIRQPDPPPVVSFQNFTVGPNLTDRQVAEQVCAQLRLSLATPINRFAIQHDAANHLFLDFYHANGRHQVTVLEQEHQLRVSVTRNRFTSFLDTLHRTTAAFKSDDWRMQFWADYNEFALWALLAMILSGIAMSLARKRMAQVSLAAGCAVFAVFYLITR
jgi:hypothetical protein